MRNSGKSMVPFPSASICKVKEGIDKSMIVRILFRKPIQDGKRKEQFNFETFKACLELMPVCCFNIILPR